MADALGVSTRQLGRDFRKAGPSPSRYILERRLERARQDLADPASARLTVADIAHRWGFAGRPHFTRVFRDRFGRTPGEVRPAVKGPGRADIAVVRRPSEDGRCRPSEEDRCQSSERDTL
ncbi:helix-turn-helix transcriptional regulator [Streptomyces albofaciens]|uniref:helix-turn-helix transcriptional regulator n=1 Tax=Streptomyces albofaciens TaxID=66866 RepID=UPI001FCC1D15|nr:helix-turn-helix transcriptional regulator [Streptomyces albofaciens]